MNNYFFLRQCVSINGSLSKLLPVVHGVPQGSILGPLLYLVFTNDLPNILKDEEEGSKDSLCCYADDTTMTVVESDHSKLSANISEKYNQVSNYMINNRLKLNDDKTHLMVICSSNARARI